MLMMRVAGVILAAGLGTRMKSNTAKVLHRVCGRPMISYVVDALRGIEAERVIAVVGHQRGRVQEVLGPSLEYVVQEQQLGTGHAVMQADAPLHDYPGAVVVANGDVPLLRAETLARLVEYHTTHEMAATVLTAIVPDPTGYGRVLRDDRGDVLRIVEHKDASSEERAVQEINTGMYAFHGPLLFPSLARLSSANAQGELYLTDIVEILRDRGHRVGAIAVDDPREGLGVNDRLQLAEADAIMRQRVLRELMLAGVTIIDPSTTYIEPTVRIGRDSVVHPFSYLAGDTEIGEKCCIGPYCHIREARVGDGVRLGTAAVLEGCRVGSDAIVGSSVRLGPGASIVSGMQCHSCDNGEG
jgi:bifunctional UDP-N-acetylglucosamine pyrophosphorylase/glucosamine-1-phosphate N-acetyltransferase